jgi:hypothetical protein
MVIIPFPCSVDVPTKWITTDYIYTQLVASSIIIELSSQESDVEVYIIHTQHLTARLAFTSTTVLVGQVIVCIVKKKKLVVCISIPLYCVIA